MLSRQASGAGALLKSILQESPDEVLVFDAASLRIVQANPAAVHNLHYPLRTFKTLTLRDCLADADAAALPDRLAALQDSPRQRMRFQAQCRRRDGSLYPADIRLFHSTADGKAVFIWIATDASEREATRRALAHSASDLRAIVAHIPGMAYQVQRAPDGSAVLRYVSAQSAQLLGIKPAALRTDPGLFYKLILDEDKPDYEASLAEAGGVHLTFNWVGRIWMEAWKDVKWVNLRVSRRDTPAGPIWDGIMLNVTHSKLAEAEIRESRAQLAALAAHVETVRERERLHLAREVHDDLGGNLTAIKIGLAWLMRHLPDEASELARRTAYLDKVVDQTIDATHRIAASLRPPALDFGIVSAIEWMLKRFQSYTDIACEFRAPEQKIQLGPDVDIAVFRIVQEALTNVAKHAHASRVKVTLSVSRAALKLTVTDNGGGIPPGAERKGGDSFGVLGMIERATTLGGELSVAPAGRRGTRVSLRVPLPGARK
ncbi:MAG: ATP-binding protein [Pseudomonadota bacterium]